MGNGQCGGKFDFTLHHIGFETDYYYHDSGNLQLSTQTIDSYENKKEGAEIFFQNATGEGFSSQHMLAWFLTQSRTTIADHLPPPGKIKAGRCYLTLPIKFQEGHFHMMTASGVADLKTLKLYVRVTAHARTA
ncbi:MAG: hypothetical protein CMM74_12070 [Rhodospirillaceae bacterium]|jgi:hypothetical protein|nr:hypothetical protein [Rhodospirillaceae bacterium]|tara:strand:+ start:323 stop:721 length:399 start_codon:yes stop_codon:yes gene_type:complete